MRWYEIKYEQLGEKIILTEFDSFIISETLECGQCFRFLKLNHNDYMIIAHHKVLRITQDDEKIIFYPTNESEFETVWIPYFDLKRNYNYIKDILSDNDFVLRDAVLYAPGIRILNQDFFEGLISFIISQNNRIPRIQQIIQNISQRYGDKIEGFDNCYAFPSVEQLLEADVSALMLCKTGFRAKYILDAVHKVNTREINSSEINDLETRELKSTLMKIAGVGDKVSDCVMLFSCGRKEVFPTDVWVKRVMQYFYFNNQPVAIQEMQDFAKKHFGEYAGFAQQYLFHYARTLQIGKK